MSYLDATKIVFDKDILKEVANTLQDKLQAEFEDLEHDEDRQPDDWFDLTNEDVCICFCEDEIAMIFYDYDGRIMAASTILVNTAHAGKADRDDITKEILRIIKEYTGKEY